MTTPTNPDREALAKEYPPPRELTDAECNHFRALPMSFNEMVRAIWMAGYMTAPTPYAVAKFIAAGWVRQAPKANHREMMGVDYSPAQPSAPASKPCKHGDDSCSFIRFQPGSAWSCRRCGKSYASIDEALDEGMGVDVRDEPSAPAEGATPVGEITCPDCNGCGGWEHGGGQDENGRSEEPQMELCQRCQSTGRIEARPYIESLRAALARAEGERDAAVDKLAEVMNQTSAVIVQLGNVIRERDEARASLAECFRLTGADPDGNEDWRLATSAVDEVRRLRQESDDNGNRADEARATAERLRAALERIAGFAHVDAEEDHRHPCPLCIARAALAAAAVDAAMGET